MSGLTITTQEARETRAWTYSMSAGAPARPAHLRLEGSARPGPGLDSHQRLHASQRLGRLLPHNVTPDQCLQLHQPFQRPQRPPRLQNIIKPVTKQLNYRCNL